MKKSDVLTFTISAREALRVYTIMGKANGDCSLCFFNSLRTILDPEGSIYREVIRKSPHILSNDYLRIQYELESIVFEGKSESQKQLDNVMVKLAELQKEAEQLQETIKKEKK
jgi:hypothetical protein